MTKQQSDHTPLIEPDKIKDIVKPEPPADSAAEGKARKPTAAELEPGQYCWGLGRRKKSVARVRVRPGQGRITINGRELDSYFTIAQDRNAVQAPLIATDCQEKFDVFVNVKGGGTTGQAGAVVMGLARALRVADPNTFDSLRDGGYLTRDSRMVERKKYGRRGARRSFQFSKR